MIARAGDCRARNSRQQGQPVHHRHVDVEQQQVDVGLLGQHRQRLLAVAREAEGEVALADALAEALLDQQLEVGLVVDGEDLGGLAHACRRNGRLTAGSCCSCCFSIVEIDRLGDELGGAVLAGLCAGARRRRRPSPS